MATLDQYRYWLQRIAIVLAVANILSVFLCDLREWFVYFDPPAFRFGVLPAFVVGLPALAFLLPARQNSASTFFAEAGLLALVTATFLFFEGLWIFQIVIATFFRGPDWNFYWPWEERIPKLVPLNTLDLSEYFWIHLLGHPPRPRNALVREVAGLALLLIHFLLVPLLECLSLKRFGVLKVDWKVVTLALIFQVLSFVALKIALRWLINIKYVFFWPEPWLNI